MAQYFLMVSSMDIIQTINQLKEPQAKQALAKLLEHYMTPAFGALPKGEVELMVLSTLQDIGVVSQEPEVYELVTKLKVTRSKARGLIYDSELRRSSEADLDGKVKLLLKKPLIQKRGGLFVLEVENPLVSDHLKAKIQKLGYVTDGSFSPSIIKLGLDAVTALIESCLTQQEQKKLKKVLIKAGAPDNSFQGVVKAFLKRLVAKVASDTGEALIDKVSEYISPIIDAAIDTVEQKAKDLFRDD